MFCILAVIAALQVTLSVGNKLYTSYNVVIRLMFVVIFSATYEPDVCFCNIKYSLIAIMHAKVIDYICV